MASSAMARLGRGVNRRLLHRDRRWEVAGQPIQLPWDHKLPDYQRVYPRYDRYFLDLLVELADAAGGELLLIDVGANVGDTAVAAAATVPNLRVVAVEGDPRFQRYLRANIEPFADRVTVVEAFVGTPPAGAYSAGGGTGGFAPAAGAEAAAAKHRWVTPAELIPDGDSVVVWKSDTDGMDVSILAEGWEVIDARCDVLWFEYDPSLDLSTAEQLSHLTRRLADSGRELAIYDNLGHPMLRTSGPAIEHQLPQLSEWLRQQKRRAADVHYVDVWAYRAGCAPAM